MSIVRLEIVLQITKTVSKLCQQYVDTFDYINIIVEFVTAFDTFAQNYTWQSVMNSDNPCWS